MKKTILIPLILLCVVGFVMADDYTTCYQESADTPNQTGLDNCNLLYTGNYAYNYSAMNFSNTELFNDGDYATSANVSGTSYNEVFSYFINYTKPVGTINATFNILTSTFDGAFYNKTSIIPPECLNDPILQIKATTYKNHHHCWNGITWALLQPYNSANPINLYDENIVWTVNTTENMPPECNIDTDCGFCEYCNSGTCENQINTDTKFECGICRWCDGTGNCGLDSTDSKDLCAGHVQRCYGSSTYFLGAACMNPSQPQCSNIYVNPSAGHVCINETSYDVPPTEDVNCGVLMKDCVAGQTAAQEYYAGWLASYYSAVCNETDWLSAGTNWTAPTGYKISTTEKANNCSVELIPVQQSSAPSSSQAGAIAAAATASAGTAGRAANTQGFGAPRILGLGIIGGIIAYNAGVFGSSGTVRGRVKARGRKFRPGRLS
jgi:hypothetical protein